MIHQSSQQDLTPGDRDGDANQSRSSEDSEEPRLIGGNLNYPLGPEILRGLEQLAARDNMVHVGPAPELGNNAPPSKPIEYKAPPGEEATTEERKIWGLGALAAFDQMVYPPHPQEDEEPSSGSGQQE